MGTGIVFSVISKIESIENSEITIPTHQITLSRNLREQVIKVAVKSKLLSK
jgi:hypothetical protein